jgi:tetratricopeptide (TPR) repeat protein
MSRAILKEINQKPSLWQLLSGSIVANLLIRGENPPINAEKLGFYVAALNNKKPEESKAKIARTLLWADFRTKSYRPKLADWYLFAAEIFPDDEKSAFYAAALLHHQLHTVPESVKESIFVRLMRPEWADSASWSRLELPRAELLHTLMDVYSNDKDGDSVRVTPERMPILDAAFDNPNLQHDVRLSVARSLGVSYRSVGRSDERAEIVSRFLFVHCPKDEENNQFLAQVFAGRHREDVNASVVYGRMVMLATEQGNESERIRWSQSLAKTYIALNQVNSVAVPVLQDALKAEPENRLLEAALAYAIAHDNLQDTDTELLKYLETALAFESEFVPYFMQNKWQWSVVPRALAFSWGRSGRRDQLANFIFARATELCPEEKELWGFYAAALAESSDYSRKALMAYEKAQRYHVADDTVKLALARTYLETRAQDGPERRKALEVWESLYRGGRSTREIQEALAEAYLREERLSDFGLDLLATLTRTESANGPLLLRIAQEYILRLDYDTALRWYQEAERRMPAHFPTLFEFGNLLKTQFSDFEGGATLLTRAIILPQAMHHLEAHIALGECFLALGRREDARQVFQIIVDRINPSHTPTLLHLARLNLRYEESGLSEAKSLFDRVANLDPNNPETYRQMAQVYHAEGDQEKEEEALEKYLQLSGIGDAERYKQLADLYIGRRDFEKAETALRQLIALGHASKDIYKLLGDVLSHGRQEAA